MKKIDKILTSELSWFMKNGQTLHILQNRLLCIKPLLNQWIDTEHKLIVKVWIKVLKLNQQVFKFVNYLGLTQ